MVGVSIQSFPKIFHIGESMIQNLFKGKVEITEKIDGSQFDFGINKEGQIVMRSHGQDLTNCDTPKMFQKAVMQVEHMSLLLEEFRDIYFYCEYLEKPHHNILTYERIPKNNLYLFGVYKEGDWISDYKELWKWANTLDIEKVNIIDCCEIKNPDVIERYLETDSVLGNTKIEGIVVKNYNEPSIRGSFFIPISMGKYVSEKFKEKHEKDWGKTTSKGKIELFIESFRTEARWNKTIQHLKELNELENEPKDIAKLMREIDRDLKEEETENIKTGLYQIFIADILRKSKAGLAEYYKKSLLEKGFEANE
jgi:hypothetical protein